MISFNTYFTSFGLRQLPGEQELHRSIQSKSNTGLVRTLYESRARERLFVQEKWNFWSVKKKCFPLDQMLQISFRYPHPRGKHSNSSLKLWILHLKPNFSKITTQNHGKCIPKSKKWIRKFSLLSVGLAQIAVHVHMPKRYPVWQDLRLPNNQKWFSHLKMS